ncbi:MAG: DUF2232 domain-containing protein [Gammaproteobacteria bacterium]|nr:DUF2232 domain-containing protein [Gammaproteobacteria bacterium]
MRLLAGYIMRGRMQAVLVASLCTVLSLILAPLGYLGAAAVSLVILRHGVREGIVVAAGSGVVACVLSQVLVGSMAPVLALIVTLWLPASLLAVLLRASGSQGLVLAAAGVFGIVVIFALHLMLEDPALWWRELIEEALLPMLSEQGVRVDTNTLEQIASIMTGLAAAVSVLGIMITLFLARWWQSVQFNPGGFGEEFRSLRLHRGFAMLTLLALLASMLVDALFGTLGREFLMLATVLYMLQGLAVAHAVSANRKASAGWLIGLYFLLVFLWPYAMLALGVAGFVDAWVDFRRRIGIA